MASTRIRLNPSFWNHPYCVPLSEDILPSSLFLKNRHYLVVDIETKTIFQEVGEGNFAGLGVSVACAYDSKTQETYSYLEKDLKKLFELCESRLVVGYNIKGFDLPVLATYGLKTTSLDVFDLMTDIQILTRQRFIKLQTIAHGTLGISKLADGLQAVQWWKEGKVDQIIEYCMQDVKITRDIFEFGRQNSWIGIKKADDTVKEVRVNWN